MIDITQLFIKTIRRAGRKSLAKAFRSGGKKEAFGIKIILKTP